MQCLPDRFRRSKDYVIPYTPADRLRSPEYPCRNEFAASSRRFKPQGFHRHEMHSVDHPASGLQIAEVVAIDSEREGRLLLRQA